MSVPVIHAETGIICLQLNNGKVNAITHEVIDALHTALDESEKNNSTIIITGQNGIFSAGYDLKIMQSSALNAIDLVTAGSTLTRRMLTHSQPIIIACSGHAVAKGAFLLLAADYRIATRGEFHIMLNEVEIGMSMHQAGIVLAQGRLTPAACQRAVINAERFTPETALQAGFVDMLVSAEELIPTALQVAEQMKRLNRRAHHKTKLAVRHSLISELDAAIAADKTYTG